MEELNKSQFILLVLLVSFVTSIATGIMTSTLLAEAPLEITRNINRIVEKTIETVTPAPDQTAAVIQKEVTTVVVKEEDQIIDSVNKNSETVVRITERNPFTDESSFYGIGVFINKDGQLVADRKPVTNTHVYTGTLPNGTKVILEPLGIDKKTNFILFRSNLPEGLTDKEKENFVFNFVVLGNNDPKLGQSIVSLGGQISNVVSVGRVTSLDVKETEVASSTVKYLAGINTDVVTKDLVVGTPLFNLSGELVGMRLSSDRQSTFTPIEVLKKELPGLTEVAKTE